MWIDIMTNPLSLSRSFSLFILNTIFFQTHAVLKVQIITNIVI